MKSKPHIYIYPKLPSNMDLGLLRIGGSGLANCMFIAARAYIIAYKNDYKFINPTWLKLSPGPYLRFEKDKRHYAGLFNPIGVHGINKILKLIFKKKTSKIDIDKKSIIVTINGLNNYFEDLIPDYDIVKSYFEKIIRPSVLAPIDHFDFKQTIGIHIRLGDYIPELRTNIAWYEKMITSISQLYPNKYQFIVFSDGTNDELKPILNLQNTKKVFFGSSLSDIVALSRCEYIIASDSTFSGWAAFLGQKPAFFPKKHFGRVLINSEKEVILNMDEITSENLISLLR